MAEPRASTLLTGGRLLDADGSRDGWVLVQGPRIAAVGRAGADAVPPAETTVDLSGRTITPGFIDLHGHGGGGGAFDNGLDEIATALAVHRAHGTTRSVISLVANPLAEVRASLHLVASLAAHDPTVVGVHLEGPFLAIGRRGAHSPEFLREPDSHTVDELLDAGSGAIRQITIAPELPGALEAVRRFSEAGVVVAVGHTEADESIARAAFDAGATLVTHAFNAMPSIHHRDPGPIVAAFDDDRITLELVSDGVHVHPAVVQMTFRAAPHRVALVTDAMAAAGGADGYYRLGSLNVEVRGGIAHLAGTSTIAGSTLTQDAALRCAVLGAAVDEAIAVEALTLTPARVLGRDHEWGRLAAGYAADLVVLDSDWQVHHVWADGALIRTP